MDVIRRRLLRRLAYARRNRCSLLVVALCLFILLNPLLMGSAVGATMLATGLFAILMLAVWALRVRRPFVWGLALFAFISISINALLADRLGET